MARKPSSRLVSSRALLAAWPLLLVLSAARAEDRKFVVMLADPSKDHPGTRLDLPNRTDIWDAYFDKIKNGQNGGPRIDSHAEWWEEVSYGDVTVSGETFGWVSVPWPTRPPGFNGDTGFGSTARIPHVDLQGGFSYEAGTGEPFSPFVTKFAFDWDGVGEDFNRGNQGSFRLPGFSDVDNFNGFPLWAPGERFLDLNANGTYDAGVFEWGIDKNGNGRIDVDRRAGSFAELFAANINYPPDDRQDDPPLFLGWVNTTEWFDANGDGQWNLDGLWDDSSGNQQVARVEFFPLDPSIGGGSRRIDFYRGDWGGRELWIDRDGDFVPGDRASQDERFRGEGNANEDEPAFVWEWLIQVNDPEDDAVEYFDEQWNDNFDFPEPFEDFLRRWDTFAHDFVRTSDEYIRANYPGNADGLIARIGNGRYDSPDAWNNNGQVNSSNKMQEISGLLLDQSEADEQIFRWSHSTGDGGAAPNWWETFWNERYGTSAPDWLNFIPYMRKFDPGTPIPQLRSQSEQPQMPFAPDRGGMFHNGRKSDGTRYVRTDGTVKPDISNRDDGMYDGAFEFDDLPSSIYHMAGDQDLGEVTSPSSNARYGEDIATPFQDGNIPAGGPLAYNVHGDTGFEAGNVFTPEYLTWRTDGTSLADRDVDFPGFGTIRFYHRDVNLDGLLDLGETPGDAGDFGLPTNEYSNYGVDPFPGTPPDGGPWSEYPWNRWRLLEDVVAALDDATDWDEFLGGPPPFGNVLSGLILLPAGTSAGMFALPAPSLDYPVNVRDGLADGQVIRRADYVPIPMFDGLGIALDESGEGDFGTGNFATAFAAHEYCHTWEGYPDLYDYDVYRRFGGSIINHPIGRWCIMAGGGLVHPVGILKEDSGWLQAIDITKALNPLGQTQLTFPTWEFNRNRVLYKYTNPLYASEQFYFWRQSPIATNPDTGRTDLTFDRFLPGPGLMIMHVDRRGNPNGLPPQQRLSGHFTYLIVQADGQHDLERDNTQNTGDAGDPFPGTSNVTRWNRLTDPSNRWYTDEGSGLDIANIVEQPEATIVTFNWTPRELPSFNWVQPPGGTSVNGTYTLKYFSFDQFGGTRIEFYIDSDRSGYNGTFLSATGKAPGDIDGAHNVNIGNLPNGTYSFYAKLVPGVGSQGRRENSVSTPRAGVDNQGNGTLQVSNGDIDLSVSLLEVWRVTCIDDASRNQERWSVVGSVSGQQSTSARTGQLFEADRKQGADGQMHVPLKFTIIPDSKRFRVGDQFTFVTTGFTAYSEAVLIFEGEIVTPKPPVAVIQSVAPATGLANWTEFTFRSASFDPAGAEITESWAFGDGSSAPGDPAPSTVTHTYAAAGNYTVTLTVTNSFGLQARATTRVPVSDPLPPVARLSAGPLEGRIPLAVTLNGSSSVDQNDPTLGGSNLTWSWSLTDGTVLNPVAGTPSAGNVVVQRGPQQGPFQVVFNKPGLYIVNMTVTNGFGRSASARADIRVSGPPADRPPVAVIEASRRAGRGPLSVEFDGSASFDPEGGLLEYTWNFGDGSPLVTGVSNASHTFTRARTYNVSLTVEDPSGLKDSATLAIVVTEDQGSTNGAPVARIVSSALQGPAPFTVELDGSRSSDPEGGAISFAWDFGDGSEPVFGPKVSHTFTEPRTYSVVLVVADAQGATGAASINVQVTLPEDDTGRPTPDDGTDGGTPPPAGFCNFGFFPVLLSLAGLTAARCRRGFRPRG